MLYPVNPDTNVADTSGGPATGVWLLRTSVDIENGVLMEVMGTSTAGGDADRVRYDGGGGLLTDFHEVSNSLVTKTLNPETPG